VSNTSVWKINNQVIEPGRARDENDPRLTRQKPSQRDLTGLRFLAFGHAFKEFVLKRSHRLLGMGAAGRRAAGFG
jgi:hypothetical protein